MSLLPTISNPCKFLLFMLACNVRSTHGPDPYLAVIHLMARTIYGMTKMMRKAMPKRITTTHFFPERAKIIKGVTGMAVNSIPVGPHLTPLADLRLRGVQRRHHLD